MVDYPLRVDVVDGIRVVRDDLVPGGTKARVAHLLLDSAEEYVYAGPCQGYAQVALALVCRRVGKRMVSFVAKRRVRDKRVVEAEGVGAVIRECAPGYLSVVRARAEAYCRETGARMIPFGMACPAIISGIAEVARGIAPAPEEVWTVAGSGTLSLALQRAWPDAKFHAVLVGKDHASVGRAQIWRAPEVYTARARFPPPFPSCGNYDAKAWRFIAAHARAGALFWNVAR